MKINKLLKQFGTYGNEYSVEEIGDTLNALLDSLNPGQTIEVVDSLPQPKEKITEPTISTEKEREAVVKDSKGGFVARSPSSGDKVYYILNKEKHWIKNPTTLKGLGFDFYTVQSISSEEMEGYETKEDMDLSDDAPPTMEEIKSPVAPAGDQKKNDNAKYYL